jgi:hypothetical protein
MRVKQMLRLVATPVILTTVLAFAQVLIPLAGRANAEDALELPHGAGFYGCDTAINKSLSFYIKSETGRISGDYFMKNPSTYALMVTFGTQGDSVFQHFVFEKKGSSCYVYQTSIITNKIGCLAWKEENPEWKYVASSGDFTWTKNKGGVDGLLNTLPSGGCSVIYNQNNIYPTDGQK